VIMLADEAVAVLRAGLAWLYDTVQPDDAIPDHHGYGARAGDRRYRFVGRGANGLPVVVASVAEPAYDKTHIDWPLLNPIGGQGEMEALVAALTGLGAQVREWWNGFGESGSVGLVRPAHPSLRAGLARYSAGCPTHNTVFCGPGCRWLASGYARAVEPAFPTLTVAP